MITSATAVTIADGAPEHVERVAPMVAATGMFRPSEVEIAVEVFGGAARTPGVDYHALVALDADGALAGFTCFGPTPGTVGTWDLYWIVVDPGQQRQGIGRRLLDASEARMHETGGRLVVVETSSRADYEPTRAFYLARGYRRSACIAGYYAPGDDLIVYTKDLNPSTDRKAHG